MKNVAALFLVLLLAVTVSACGNGETNNTEPPPVVSCTGDGSNITAADVNNYQFTSTLTFPTVKVKTDSELNFDWSGVSKDFLGHAVDPKNDLNLISVLSWQLPLAERETVSTCRCRCGRSARRGRHPAPGRRRLRAAHGRRCAA